MNFLVLDVYLQCLVLVLVIFAGKAYRISISHDIIKIHLSKKNNLCMQFDLKDNLF